MNRVSQKRLLLSASAAATLALSSHGYAASKTWTGTSSDGLWTTSGNWSGGTPTSADTAVFANSATLSLAGQTVNVNGTTTIKALQFGVSSSTVAPVGFTLANTVSGGTLTLNSNDAAGDGVYLVGTNANPSVTISTNLVLASTASTGDLVFSLTDSAANAAVAVTGVISGLSTTSLVVRSGTTGTVTLQLYGTNTYAGQTRISGGTVQVFADSPSSAVTGGAFGIGTSAILLGDANTSPTHSNISLLTGDNYNIGRDITIIGSNTNGTFTGITALGASSSQTVSSTFSGTISLGRTLSTFQSYTTGSNYVDFSGKITGSGGFVKAGTGAIQLDDAANDYLGSTIVRNGTVYIGADAPSGSAGALGNSSAAVAVVDSGTTASSAVSLLTVGNYTVGRNLTVGAVAASVTIGGSSTQTAGSIYSGQISLGQSISLTSDTTDSNVVDFSGKFTGTGGLNKVGGGTVRISNTTNDYNGNTTVSAGTLLIDGQTTSVPGTTVTANSGTTLAGSGAIPTSLVATGATIHPGTPGVTGTPGVLTIGGSASITGGNVVVDLSGGTQGSGTGHYGAINATGDVTLGGAPTLTLNLIGSTSASQDNPVVLYLLTSQGNLTGQFSNFTEGQQFVLDGQTATLTYLANWTGDSSTSSFTGGNDVAISVPEPASLSMLGLLGGAFHKRKRRLGKTN